MSLSHSLGGNISHLSRTWTPSVFPVWGRSLSQRVREGSWCPAIGAEIPPIIIYPINIQQKHYPKGALSCNQAHLPRETGVFGKMEDGQVASAWGNINTQGQVSV